MAAASSGDDVPTQLSALLGKEVAQMRMTDENPPRISVIDVAMAVTGGSQHDAARDLRRLSDQHPEVGPNWPLYKFKGRRQRDTPVTDARGIVEVIMLLPGHQAARVRRQAAELLVRYLGGDLALVDEVCAIRGFQEQLAARRPGDPRRIFGEAVESTGPTIQQFSQLLASMDQRMAAQEQSLARIQESLEHDKQRVNLNVRAPKRKAPYNPPVARSIAGLGRPLPVARFLDEKERADPSWSPVRRSFAPTFSMQAQVLKKRQLRRDGEDAIYVEQNHRPQLLYTERDRTLMEDAWELTSAHRESLGGYLSRSRVAMIERTSVLDMLRK